MKFAVAYLNFFDNELMLKIVEGDNWKTALINSNLLSKANVEVLPDDLNKAKDIAFDGDYLIEVKEI